MNPIFRYLLVAALIVAAFFVGKSCQTTSEDIIQISKSQLTEKTLGLQPKTTKPIPLSLATRFTDNYDEFTDALVVSKFGLKKIKQIVHADLCEKCAENEKNNAYPSFSIDRETLDIIAGNSAVQRLMLYPAAHKSEDDKNKYLFTIVLVGADENGKVVKRAVRQKPGDDLEIWEYINPCPPPTGCQQIGQ